MTDNLLTSDAAFTGHGYEGSTQYPAVFISLTSVRYPLGAGWTQGRPRPREQILAFTRIRTHDHRYASRARMPLDHRAPYVGGRDPITKGNVYTHNFNVFLYG